MQRRQLDRLPDLALERRGALLDARRLDEAARHGGEIADRELVDAVGHGRRRHVHVVAQIPGGERAGELARLLDVLERVLAPRGAEHHVVRLLADGVEEAVGADVADPVAADGRYPADRPRPHDGLEGVVLEAVLVLDRLVKHWCSPCALPRPSAGPTGHDLGELRAIAIGLPFLGRADVDEPGHPLVGGESQSRHARPGCRNTTP